MASDLSPEDRFLVTLATRLAGGLLALVAVGMWGCPHYAVWQQRLSGEAALARATQDRQIAVQEAQAKKDASTLLAEAEVLRAHGVAQAQAIINATLTDKYIQWLMAEKLSEKATVIYVPTEAQIPILEAGRR